MQSEVRLDFRLSLLRLSIWDLEFMEWGWSSVGKEVLLEVEVERQEDTERMKRHLKEKVLKIEKKLVEYEQMRKLHRDARKKKGMPTIGIV